MVAMKRFFCKLVKDFKPAYRALWLTLRGRRGKSPINKDHERRAGDYTMRELLLRLGVAIFLVGMVVGGIITAYSLTKFALIAVLVSLPLLLACVPLLPVLWYQAENYFLGHVGERIVGDELAKVAAHRQWRVFHGFDIGFGDIDHIIVCPKGIFCVETKMLRKHPKKAEEIIFKDGALWRNGFLRLSNPDPIEKTKKNALRLRKHLGVERVHSFVAFPGWWVAPPEHGHHDKYVTPCNPETIGGKLAEKPDILSGEQIERVCAILEKNNRVEPTAAP